jgi:hypothetical protein
MRFVIFVSLFLFSTSLFAQTIDYPKGVYMTYNELMAKKPSKKCEFVIFKRKIYDIKLTGGADFEMQSDKKCIKSKKIKNDVFAYSNGYSLYINGKLITGKPGYSVVKEFGRFLLFEAGLAQFGKMNDIQVTSYPYMFADGKIAEKRKFNAVVYEGDGVIAAGIVFGLTGAIVGQSVSGSVNMAYTKNLRFYYVIDQKHNQIKTLDINAMREFLDDYPELLKEYNKIELKHDKDVYLKYIQLMNEADTGKY